MGIAEFIAQCDEAEVPQWIREACVHLKALCQPTAAAPAVATVVAALAADPGAA